MTQMHRKSLIRLLNSPDLERQKRQRERGKTYGADVQYVLGIVCESFDYPCAERLVGNPDWLAMLGKRQRVVADGCARIVDRIAFPILQLHPDNGSESLNHRLPRFWRQAVPSSSGQSRPYQSDDNRFGEQKHGFLIRKMFGQERLDTVA
ncbi:MAG: hypothetical protein J7M15_04115 [Anaerolineae bacterium]|nr:hypothetical protein [Anaerolineae bacterium]